MRVILLGNAGAGKSTLARQLIGESDIPRLSLDEIAWGDGADRLPLAESLSRLADFLQRNPQWVIEGCYSDLVEAALPHCTALVFLNPGIDACVTNCRRRPFEPEKFASPEEQDANLENLIAWVRDYDSRTDEYGLQRHRRVFDAYPGRKLELTNQLPNAAEIILRQGLLG